MLRLGSGRVLKNGGLVRAITSRRMAADRKALCIRQSYFSTQSEGDKNLPTLAKKPVQEAVNNLLYNVPTAKERLDRHVLSVLVSNETGVLSRISGVLAARGFNIDSLVVSSTEVASLSRMTVVLTGDDDRVEQARRQVEDMVPVWAVMDYSKTKLIQRELLLIKVSLLPPEQQALQFVRPRLNETAEQKQQRFLFANQQREALECLTRLFPAKIVDVGNEHIIIELCAKSRRVDSFIELMRPFGIIECSRSGRMVMPRTPVDGVDELLHDQLPVDDSPEADVSHLPPG